MDLQFTGRGFKSWLSTLGKLLTPMCLYHQAVYFGIGQGGWSLWLGTAGLVESNGTLPPGLWLMSPLGWLPSNRNSNTKIVKFMNYRGNKLSWNATTSEQPGNSVHST